MIDATFSEFAVHQVDDFVEQKHIFMYRAAAFYVATYIHGYKNDMYI